LRVYQLSRMKFLLLVALFVACAFAVRMGPDTTTIAEFAKFMKDYNKHYETQAEMRKRFDIFSSNLKLIQSLNAASNGAKYNISKFADMSEAEFHSYPCGVDKLSMLNSRRPGFVPATKPFDLNLNANPTSWDWTTKGAVTPIKDQGQCGSCWAFSTIGNIEGVWFLAGNPLTGLSEQQEVDCSSQSGDQGCDGGWPFWAMTDMLAAPYNGRIDSETGYPYTAQDGSCAFGTNDVGATIKSYTSYCTEQTAACTETQMEALLVQYGPLSACLDAGPMQFYQSGIDNPTDCDPTYIDHCITIVGYGVQNGVKFWKIKNSWGTDWGTEGYYYLIKGIGACGINTVITVAAA